MSITFEIPSEIETQLRTPGADPDREAKEAYLVELYRQERISHAQLRASLDLSFHQTEELLRHHGVGHDLSLEEFQAERAFLQRTRRR